MDLQFEDPLSDYKRNATPREAGFDITGLVVRLGLAKSRKQASYILLAAAVLALILAFVFWPRSSQDIELPPVSSNLAPSGNPGRF